MATPARNKHGRFMKGGHKHHKRSHAKRSHARRSTAMTHHRASHSSAPARRTHRRRGGSGGAEFGNLVSARFLVPAAVLAAAWGYAAGNSKEFNTTMEKIPGVKSYGLPIIVGGVAFVVNRYLFPNKWLRLLAAIGLVLGVMRWGNNKFSVDWVGDVADADGAVADVS